jgi:hypothetical protein
MPGLDPGIHQSSSQLFSKKMDRRVKPGDDDFNSRHAGHDRLAPPRLPTPGITGILSANPDAFERRKKTVWARERTP